MVFWRVDRMNVGCGADPGRQNADQLAAAQIAGDVPFRAQHDAMPGQRPVDGNFTMIDSQRPVHFDRGLCLAIGQLPVVEGEVIFADDDAVMVLQVAWLK